MSFTKSSGWELQMPFVIMIIGLLGGLQIYFFNTADRAQKSIAAQILLSRSQKNINEEVVLEQLLSIQIQELMKRNGISALDLEKGLSAVLNKSNPQNPAEDQISPLFKPSPNSQTAASELLEFKDLKVGVFDYKVKAIGSSLPRDPTGYLDLAVCPVKKHVEDTRKAKKMRMRLSVKAGFLNAVTGTDLTSVFSYAEIFGNVAEFGQRSPLETPNMTSTRVYGSWMNQGEINKDMTEYLDGRPYDVDQGDESKWLTGSTPFAGPKKQMLEMGNDIFTDYRTTPRTFDASTVNPYRSVPHSWWRSYAMVKDVESRYDGPELPWNPQTRSRSLPKFNPDMTRILARGTISVQDSSHFIHVPYGKTWNEKVNLSTLAPDADSGLSVLDGNVILDGRSKPFNICGRVFVSGDIVVMGQYSSKNTDGSSCQSALIAGRNIYVVDDLKAFERAPNFDKTKQANVDVLSRVSDPATARKLAEDTWNSDQLVLMAANNVYVGNPFPFDANEKTIKGRKFLEPAIGNGIFSIVTQGLNRYQDELYYYRSTGVMAVPNVIYNTTKICYTLPWENVETTCRSVDGNGDFESNKRFVKVGMYEDEYLNEVNDQLAQYHILYAWYVPEAYWKLFLPMNVVNKNTGELKAWIDEKQFASVVRDAADKAKFVTPDACGRTGVLSSSILPYRDSAVLKAGQSLGGFVQDVDPDKVMEEVDNLTGFLSTYGDYPVEYKEIGWKSQNVQQYTVREMFKRQLNMCLLGRARMNAGYNWQIPTTPHLPEGMENQQNWNEWKDSDKYCSKDLFTPSWTSSDPGMNINSGNTGTNWEHGRTFDLQNREYNFISYDKMQPAQGWSGMAFDCYVSFYVAQKTPNCSGGKPTSFAMSSRVQQYEWYAYAGNNNHVFCFDSADRNGSYGYSCQRTLERREHIKCAGCMDSGTLDKSKCVPTGKYYYYWNSADSGIAGNDYRVLGPDFNFSLAAGNWWRPEMMVNSRFLTGKTANGVDRSEVFQNRVKEIDAFVFANQFAALNSETDFDRSLQINGGIASRDVLGNVTSKVGPYRPGYNSADPTEAYRSPNGGSFEPGMIVAWDPRYRYTEDIIQADVGSSEMTEGTTAANEACAAVSNESGNKL